jgi:hypothetical protein
MSIAGGSRDQAQAAGADAFVAKGRPAEVIIGTVRHIGRLA